MGFVGLVLQHVRVGKGSAKRKMEVTDGVAGMSSVSERERGKEKRRAYVLFILFAIYYEIFSF